VSELPTSPVPIAWLGEAPGECAHAVRVVRTLVEFAALEPQPQLLVVDLPADDGLKTLEALAPYSVAELSVLWVTDALDAQQQARAVELKVQCLPRALSAARRDEVLRAALKHPARRNPDALMTAAARSATQARFCARTLDEAEGLATLLAMFCPEPERRIGGFLELLINAIEHGNLEISGPQKRALLAEGNWHAELLRRLDLPQYAQRTVRVTFDRGEHGITFSIEDDGAGFDAKAVLAGELAGNDTQHGRGIALARLMSFDELVYEGRGNRLVGKIR
jgi:signal transduction histidine kinase